MQKIQNHDGSGLVTIPKRYLERDGLVDEDGTPTGEAHLTVDRLGERVYAVRVCDGDVPEVEDTEVIERLAAQKMLQQDALGKQRAD